MDVCAEKRSEEMDSSVTPEKRIKVIQFHFNLKSVSNIHQNEIQTKRSERSDISNPYQNNKNTQKRLPFCRILIKYLDRVLTIVTTFIIPLL